MIGFGKQTYSFFSFCLFFLYFALTFSLNLTNIVMKKLLTLLLVCVFGFANAQTTTLLSEDFSGGFPSNWYGTQGSLSLCTDSFHIENSASFTLDPVIQGNFMLATSYQNGTPCQASTYFITNAVDCTPYDSTFLSFDIDFDPYITGNDTVTIWLWDGFNWNFLDATDSVTTGSITFNITQYIGSIYTGIEFLYRGYDGNYCAIDNVLIEGVNYPGTGALTVSVINLQNVSCYGNCDGLIDITVSGGTPPYSYTWSNGATSEDISGLCSSPYSVTVVDSSGNNGTWSGSLYQPNLLTASSTTVPATSCSSNDGSINITVSGGTPPYSYYLNGSLYTAGTFNNLSAGTYGIGIIDANGCTDSIGVTITSLGGTGPTVNPTSTNVSCFGSNDGEITLGLQATPITTIFSEDFSSGPFAIGNNGTCDGFIIDNSANYSWWGNGMSGDMATSWSTVNGNPCQADSWLILPYSGNIDLSGYTNPVLEFYHEFDDWGSANDTGYVAITTDAGLTWSLITSYTSSTFGVESFNISNYISSDVWILFQHQGYNGGNWSIDNVSIIDSPGQSTVIWTGPNGFTSNLDTLSNLSAGNYNYSVTDAGGCSTNGTVTISEPQQITSIDSLTACDSHTWIDGNTYTSSNNTASDTLTTVNGCDSIVTLDLTINNSTTHTDSIIECDSYIWAINGSTYTSSVIDTVIGVNSIGCTETNILILTITGNPTAVITQNGIDLEVTSATTYNWNTGGTTQTITPTANGWYWCIVTDVDGCMSDTAHFEVTNIVSGINNLSITNIKLFPNPTNGLLTIEFNSKTDNDYQINIVNLVGETIFTDIVIDSRRLYSNNIDLSNAAKGIYFVKIISDLVEINKKLILQ